MGGNRAEVNMTPKPNWQRSRPTSAKFKPYVLYKQFVHVQPSLTNSDVHLTVQLITYVEMFLCCFDNHLYMYCDREQMFVTCKPWHLCKTYSCNNFFKSLFCYVLINYVLLYSHQLLFKLYVRGCLCLIYERTCLYCSPMFITLSYCTFCLRMYVEWTL